MPGFRFLPPPEPMRLEDAARVAGARLARGDPDATIAGVAPVETAAPGDLVLLDHPGDLRHLSATRATACLCAPRHAGKVPRALAVIETPEPGRAYARIVAALYPDAVRRTPVHAGGAAHSAFVHPDALLEPDVRVDAGAVIGARAEIGRGTIVGAGAVVGEAVAIGRDCEIGPQATILHALVGNRVVLHPGVRIGQDGSGFVMRPAGPVKVPRIGRVVIQDGVEIGANATIDRGGLRDTVIGEGTKIDNQVQIGHGVEIGRHCAIAAQVGIAESARLGDFVTIGGQTGIGGRIAIGDGARVAAASAVRRDVPAGARYGGVPARPLAEWFRALAALRKLAQKSPSRTPVGL